MRAEDESPHGAGGRWTAWRLVDVAATVLTVVPLTLWYGGVSVEIVLLPRDSVVSCIGAPKPGDPWICHGNHPTIFVWVVFIAFALWMVIVYGGVVLSLRRGWPAFGWPLLGFAMLLCLVVCGRWALPSP